MASLCPCRLRGAYESLLNIVVNFPGPGDKPLGKTLSLKSIEVNENFRYVVFLVHTF